MSFSIALSGLNAATADLDTTSNNIANSATTGFKSSRAEFSELFSASALGAASNSVGEGVRVATEAQQFTQGNINATGNNLDLAISGQGFFIVSQAGALSYTRSGSFQVDNNGFIVNSQNQRLQAYPPAATGGFNTGGLGDLQLVTSVSAPAATTNAQVLFNLPANASAPTVAPFDPTNPSSYNQTTSLTLYDSLGAVHTGTLYFVKTATPNQWTTQLYVDGTAVGTPQALNYSSSGVLTAPATGTFAFPAYTPSTGAAPINLTLNVAGTTQFGDAFSVNSITQDGFTTGRLSGIAIDGSGAVQAQFTNGKSTPLGQVAMANFANAQGLQQLDNTNWAETFASGQPLRGQAGSSGLGIIQSGSLETSNVDLTQQLVNMITAQRNFQANAQVISTTDQITQTIINIR
jgi:flagellar hook protein FlgE